MASRFSGVTPAPPAESAVGEIMTQLTKVMQLQLEARTQMSQLAAGQGSILSHILEAKDSAHASRSFGNSFQHSIIKPRISSDTFLSKENRQDSRSLSIRHDSRSMVSSGSTSVIKHGNSMNTSVVKRGIALEEFDVAKSLSKKEPEDSEDDDEDDMRRLRFGSFVSNYEQSDENSEDEEVPQVVCELHSAWHQKRSNALKSTFMPRTLDIFKASCHQDSVTHKDSHFSKLVKNRTLKFSKSRQRSNLLKSLNRMMVAPSSNILALWSLFEAALLFYDMLSIPASLLHPPDTVFDDVMKFVSVIFWTIDLPASLFKGFVTRHGDTEMSFSKVSKHYLKQHFVADLILLVIEYVNFVMWLGEDDSVRVTGRFLRMLRFTRLLKVAKFQRLLKRLMGQVSSPAVETVILTCSQLTGIVLLCHTGACIWYAIGENHSEMLPLGVQGTYIDLQWVGLERSADFAYRYSTCLLWALSQLGCGGVDIYPTNTVEGLYSCAFMLACMMSLYLWLAALISSLIRLQRLKELDSEASEKLREYLRMHKVSYNVRNRVWRFLKANPEEETMLLEEEIAYYKDLPRPLALELRVEVFIPILTLHPFFGNYGVSNADKHCMQRLMSGHAVQHARLQSEENLFLPGDSGRYMYFVITGGLEYHWNGTSASILTKSWLSEASLWLQWCHNGHVTAPKRSELVTLQADSFRSVMTALPEAQRYAKVFYSLAFSDRSLLSDLFPDVREIIQMAQDIFSPLTSFSIENCYPEQSEWTPQQQDWKFIWKSYWTPSNLLSSSAMILTLTSEMKHDAVMVFQTLFAQNMPMKEPFSWASEDERAAYDLRVMFLKRFLILLALCKVQFSEENNGTALKSWKYPLASTICHGGRILLQLQDVTWQHLVNYLLLGQEATSQGFAPQQAVSPFYTRRAATHGVVMEKDTLSLREVKLSGAAALGPNHFGMDVPVGGLGNPLPHHSKYGDLWVGPAGIPYRKKDHKESHRSSINYVSQIQHGHVYMRFDDFGHNTMRRLYPVKKRGSDLFHNFNVQEESIKPFIDSNPSLCFNGISLGHMDWQPVNAFNEDDLDAVLQKYGLGDAVRDEDKLTHLNHFLQERELLLEAKQHSEELHCRGNLIHLVLHLTDEKKIFVHTGATATEEKPSEQKSEGKSRSRGRHAFAEINDMRVPTVVCRHNELWTFALSRYCKKVFGLGEAASAYVVQCCEERASLYIGAPAPSMCYQHIDSCSDGIPLEYEILQLTVPIDTQNRQLFDPLLSDPDGKLTTIEEHVDVHGFAHLRLTGTVSRYWQWMTEDELAEIKVKGLHAPKNATKLSLLSESLHISSLLVGIEACAPLKEDIFGNKHGIEAKTKELSAFGKRKWRDFRTGSQAMPADLGSMRVVVNSESLERLKKFCSDLELCQPSECFAQGTEPTEEMETFQRILQSNEHYMDAASELGVTARVTDAHC